MKSHLRIAIVTSLLMIASAHAQTLITIESSHPVKETTDRLASELEKRGIKVATRIDHAAGAKSVGLDMPPTEVIMFGNPRLGTPLMLADPSMAIELPMKMIVWQDRSGKVLIGYASPQGLKDRYKLAGQEQTLATMGGALDGLAKAAAQK